MQILDNAIINREFKNIYLIFGEEYYLKNLYEKKLVDAIVSEETKMMNFNLLEEKSISVDKIEEISNTLPFMNDYRLLLIKDSKLFIEGKKAETDKLLKYINNIPNTTIIIFVEEKVDKKFKIFKEIKKLGEVCEFNSLSEQDLTKWILNKLSESSKKMSLETCIYLIRNVGGNMEVISNELEKLINFKNEQEITKKDIDEICTKSIESRIFDLVSAIGNKDTNKALTLYKALIFNKTSPFMILSMIARQFRIILQVKYLDKQNKNIMEISNNLGLRDFIVKEALKQSKNFKSFKILLNAINDCVETDNKCKIGLLKDDLAIEMLIVKYCNIN